MQRRFGTTVTCRRRKISPTWSCPCSVQRTLGWHKSFLKILSLLLNASQRESSRPVYVRRLEYISFQTDKNTMGTIDWSPKCSDTGAASSVLAGSHGLLRHTRHAHVYGHASRRTQRQICAQPVTLHLDSSSEASGNKWDWHNLKRGWLQAGAGVSCAAVIAANVAPLLSQSTGDGGSGDGKQGGGGGGGGGDGAGGKNHIYDLAEDAEQG